MSVFTSGTRVRSVWCGEQVGTVVSSCGVPPTAPRDSGPWYMVSWDRNADAPMEASDLVEIR